MKRSALAITLALCSTVAFAQQTPEWSTDTHHPHFADIDGDGVSDLLLQAKTTANSNMLLLGQTKQNTVNINLTNAIVVLGDIDGDGHSDLFVVYPDQQTAMTYLGNAQGLQSIAAHQYNVESLGWLNDAADVSLLAGDFDGDGKQDILVVDEKKHYMMHAGIDGQLSVVQTINGNAKWGSKRTERWIVRDFDGDGLADIFAQAKKQNQKHTITYADKNGFLKNKNSHKIKAKITDVDWNSDDFSIGAGNINDDKAIELIRYNNSGGMIDENGVFTPGEAVSSKTRHSYAPGKNKASTTQSLIGEPVFTSFPNYPGNGGNSYKAVGVTYSIPFDSVSGASYYELYESTTDSNYSLKYSGNGTSANFIHYGWGYQYYRYKACNAIGCTGYSDARRIYVYTKSGTPNNFAVSPLNVGTNANYTMSWTPAGGAVDGAVYTLYESLNGGAESAVYSIARQTWQEYNYSFTTSRSAGGSYRYRVNACNPMVACSGTVTAYQTVIAPNTPPIANADSIMLTQGSSVYINVVGNDWDAEGQALTPIVYNLPAHGSTAIVNNHVRYTPYGNYYGTDSFTYWAQDSQGAYSGLAQVTLTINAVILTPAKPTITVLNAATGRLTLSWATQANASKYTLQEAFCGTSCNSLNWQTLTPDTSALFINRTVQTGGIWAYRILACTSTNICSGYSDMATSQINRIPVVFIHSDLLGTPVAHTNEAGDLL
ncbi:MAG: FG-GAP-like repeat-containing protein [Psychrosphaera sp.]|nr:FG-GAP-like repeat-containing protein [Psychrosphaera sp.]